MEKTSSDSITAEDLRKAVKIGKTISALGLEEPKPKSEQQLIEKYTELKILSQFLVSFDTGVFQKFSSKISSNYESEQILSHLAEESGRTSPLYDDSYDVEMSEAQKVEADFGFFESTTQMPEIDRLIGNEEYVNQCIKRARNYFNQECGNSEAKRMQLSDY
jgi:hypothetical protein